MSELGRILIGIGLLLVVVGAVVILVGKTGLPLGRLPGDFTWRGRHTTVVFPLATCLIISVVLSLVLWLLGRLR
jgi:ribose/xylose/arabinose/galactoside ABC-type transport system permease subunit